VTGVNAYIDWLEQHPEHMPFEFKKVVKDLTQIDGVDVMTATTILSEVGWDMSK